MHPILQTVYGIKENRPAVALAPMAGVTDLPFRTLCESLGADYSVTEMVATAPQLLASGKNKTRLHFTVGETPNILQIIGNDANQMADAVTHYTSSAEQSIDIIDINLGCPAKKISRKGAGSALLSDLPLVDSILAAVVAASPMPVTLKTRLGPSHDNYTLLAIAEMAVSHGIELMTVHGRTRACRFNGQAQFEEIAKIKQQYPYLAVIANGDITSVDQAKKVLKQTQCDGIMIGRGAVGNPWLFNEIRQIFNDDLIINGENKTATILAHIEKMHQFYGADKGVRFARKHIQAYLNKLGKNQQFTALAAISRSNQQLQELARIIN